MTLPRGADLDALAVYAMLAFGLSVWGCIVWQSRPRRKKPTPKWWDVPKPKKPWKGDRR